MNKFYIRPEGISKPCPLYAAVYTEQDLELAENKEFILKGIHVIEYDASREKIISEMAEALKLLIADFYFMAATYSKQGPDWVEEQMRMHTTMLKAKERLAAFEKVR